MKNAYLFVGGNAMILRPGITITAKQAAGKPVWALIAEERVLLVYTLYGNITIKKEDIDILALRASRQRALH